MLMIFAYYILAVLKNPALHAFC